MRLERPFVMQGGSYWKDMSVWLFSFELVVRFVFVRIYITDAVCSSSGVERGRRNF
jgi:hypothetical protein